ncbi:MAG: tetratricopeptide repeat protein [Planctomycetes bacterium]|nr:tetratricopeptide repeat protein [Planctomycetota bacterium]
MDSAERHLLTIRVAALATGIVVSLATGAFAHASPSGSYHEDNGKDYSLRTNVYRQDGQIVRMIFQRTTLVEGVRRRERRTDVFVDANGNKRYETKIWCYHENPAFRGQYKFGLGLDEMALWWREQADKYGVKPEVDGEACDLDDASKVPDKSFEGYATIHQREYVLPSKQRSNRELCTWFSSKEPIEWNGLTLKAARCAYWENPQPPPHPSGDWTSISNTVAFRCYVQPVDDAGAILPTSRRYVQFQGEYRHILIQVEQEMDYTASPRPTIKSYSITHCVPVFNVRQTAVRGPDECRNYKVEIEDVVEGEPALQGQWIRLVTFPDGIVPKAAVAGQAPTSPAASVGTPRPPEPQPQAVVTEHGSTPKPATAKGNLSRPRTKDTVVAAFNFQMKNGTPAFLWIEKALADRMITDIFRSQRVQVVQRDTMQRVAETMKWTPELMESAESLDAVRQHVRPEYLISGTYDVVNNALSMTAVIIDMQSHQEVARRSVAGSVNQVLDLIRELSAEVLAWLVEGKPDQLLTTLPAWTRSIPATRALYEGVDLYDHGRYAEAWRLFRQASREDAGYVEARYWVAKMYYFMNRFDHARRGFEEFLYHSPDHPRVGDALREGVHSFESSGANAELLLQLYEKLENTHGNAKVMTSSEQSARNWLRSKRENLLKHLDPCGESAALDHGLYGQAMRGADIAALKTRHLLVTGEPLDTLENLRYKFDETPRSYLCGAGASYREKADKYLASYPVWYTLVAAKRMVLDSVTVFAKTKPHAEGDVTVAIGHVLYGGVFAKKTESMKVAREKGVTLTGFLPSQWLQVKVSHRSTVLVEELELSARARKPETAVGAIRTACLSPTDYVVRIDDQVAASGNEIVGFVPVGRHTVTLMPSDDERASLYEPWQTTVEVLEGKATEVVGCLPWKKDIPFASWRNVRLLARDYALPSNPGDDVLPEPPAVYLDNDCIRIVWSHGDDLWISQSSDGDTFSAPRRIDTPVSSAWRESNPRMLRDETGRSFLIFESNRDILHQKRSYVSWSRDSAHWSNPAMADPRLFPIAVNRDGSDQFLTLDRSFQVTYVSYHVLGSNDLFTWRELGEPMRLAGSEGLLERAVAIGHQNGCIEIAGLLMFGNPVRNYWLVSVLSKGGAAWTKPRLISRIPFAPSREYTFSAFCDGTGRTTVAIFGMHPDCIRISREKADGTWEVSPWFDGIAGIMSDMAWHPRWGYVLAWNKDRLKSPRTGPYVTRCKNIDDLFQAKPHPTTQERVAEEFFQLGRAYELDRPTKDDAVLFYTKVKEEFPKTQAAAKDRERLIDLQQQPSSRDNTSDTHGGKD